MDRPKYNKPRPDSQWARKADEAVARFTHDILGIARDADVDYAYAGNKGGRSAEITRVMDINASVVKDLLKK